MSNIFPLTVEGFRRYVIMVLVVMTVMFWGVYNYAPKEGGYRRVTLTRPVLYEGYLIYPYANWVYLEHKFGMIQQPAPNQGACLIYQLPGTSKKVLGCNPWLSRGLWVRQE